MTGRKEREKQLLPQHKEIQILIERGQVKYRLSL